MEPKKSLNFKFCFDNSFSLVSEKKIRFEIFPDIDMDEWQEQLEEFRQEHEGKDKTIRLMCYQVKFQIAKMIQISWESQSILNGISYTKNPI